MKPLIPWDHDWYMEQRARVDTFLALEEEAWIAAQQRAEWREPDRLLLTNTAEFDRLLGVFHRMLSTAAINAPRIIAKRLGDYTPEKVDWVWDQRIPRGKPSILAGDGGEGKSYATLGIAAALTTGKMLPGGSPAEPGKVLMWNGEDAPADTIYARAESAGADLSRIIMLEEINDRGKRQPFSLRHLPVLEAHLADDPEISLVVIDPITALLTGIDSHRDTEVRSALQPLSDLAKRSKTAILMVMHLNKSEHASVLHRLSGSIGFGALARSVLFLGTHAQSGRKSIDCIKHNLSKGQPDPVEFAIGDDGFRWVGFAPGLTARAISLSRAKAERDAKGPTRDLWEDFEAQ